MQSAFLLTNPLASQARKWSLRFAVFSLFLFQYNYTLAQDKLAAVIEPDYESEIELETGEGYWTQMLGRADGMHEYVSGGLESAAQSVDLFFAEDNVFEESTKSYIRMGLDSVWRENEGVGFKGKVKLKIDLPNTKKRLRLLIESEGERGGTENLEDRPEDAAQGNDYSVAVEKEVSALKLWNVRPSLGIRVHTPLNPFVRIRSYRYFPAGSWVIRVSSGAAWFDSRGYDIYGALEFDHELSESLLFRYSHLYSWREDEMFRRYSQGVSLFQQIDEKQRIAYQIIGHADDEYEEGWRARRYDVLARYRRNLYKKWLFGEIIPQWTYWKESGFNSTPAIIFRLEVVFGGRYR